jgi:Ca2+:H+ antiporter
MHWPHCSRGGAGVDRFDLPLVLGLEPKDMAMLALTFLVSAVTLGTGRTYMMQGAVHLVLFAAFLLLAFVP